VSFAASVPLFGMLGEWLNRRAGVSMVEIRYKASAQANSDALSGTVPMIFTAFGPFEQHLKAGKLRVIAVTRAVDDYPQVPTVARTFPDFSQNSFVILAGPAGLAPELVQRINQAAASVVQDPKFNQDLKTVRWRNLEGARTPQGTAEFIRREREAWGRFIREAGIKPS
jgi:tripartite-type tricarboxylate transporter receptor subunit TctC